MITRNGIRYPGINNHVLPTTRLVALVRSEDIVLAYHLDDVTAICTLKRYIDPQETIIGVFQKVM